MQYLPLILAFAKVIEPIMADVNAATAEAKSSDPTIVRLQKIVADAEDALAKVFSTLS